MNSKTNRKRNDNKENDDGLNVDPQIFVEFAKSNLFEDAVKKILSKSLKKFQKNLIYSGPKKHFKKNELQKANKDYIKKVVIFYFDREKKNFNSKRKEIEESIKKFKEEINEKITKNEKRILSFELEISSIKEKFDVIKLEPKLKNKKNISKSTINKIEKSILIKSNITPKFHSIDEEDFLMKKLKNLEDQQNILKHEVKQIKLGLETISKIGSKESYFKSENLNENDICSLISKPNLSQIKSEKNLKLRENTEVEESHLIEMISNKLSLSVVTNQNEDDTFKSNFELIKKNFNEDLDFSDSDISNVSNVKSIKSLMVTKKEISKKDDKKISRDLFNSFASFIPDQNELDKIDPHQLKIFFKIFKKNGKKKRKKISK